MTNMASTFSSSELPSQLTGADLPSECVERVLIHNPALQALGERGEALVRACLMSFSIGLKRKLRIAQMDAIADVQVVELFAEFAEDLKDINKVWSTGAPASEVLNLSTLAWWQAFEVSYAVAGQSRSDLAVHDCRQALAQVRGGQWASACTKLLLQQDQASFKDDILSPVHLVLGPWLRQIPDPQPFGAWALAIECWKNFQTSSNLQDAIQYLQMAVTCLRDLDSKSEAANMAQLRLLNALATTARKLGRFDVAFPAFDQALAEYEQLIEVEGRQDLRDQRAWTRQNRADALRFSNELVQALAGFEQALAEYDQLIELEGRQDLRDRRAWTWQNRAEALTESGELAPALAGFEQALAEYDQLIELEGRQDLRDRRAWTWQNRAEALTDSGELAPALEGFKQALAEYEQLIEVEGRQDLRDKRAYARQNRAIALRVSGELAPALEGYKQALADYDQLINNEGRQELRYRRASTRHNRAIALKANGELAPALEDFEQALAEYDQLIDSEGRLDLRDRRANTRLNRADILRVSSKLAPALAGFDQALADYDQLIEVEGRQDMRRRRASTRHNRALALTENGELDQALAGFEQAREGFVQLVEDEGQVQRLALAVATNAALTALSWRQQDPGRADDCTRELTDWLAAKPLDHGHIQFTALQSWVAHMSEEVDQAQWQRLAEDPLGLASWQRHWTVLLAWVADFVREMNPQWASLPSSPKRFKKLLAMVLALARQQGPQEVTRWFLRTQGLRAQRSALLPEGDDPQVREWRELWQRHDGLVTQLLQGAVLGDGSGSLRDASQVYAKDMAQRRCWDAERLRTSERLKALRVTLEQRGLLPPQVHLDLSELENRLQPGQGLLLLALLPNGNGWMAQAVGYPTKTIHQGALPAAAQRSENSALLHWGAVHHWESAVQDGSVVKPVQVARVLSEVDQCMAVLQVRSLRDGDFVESGAPIELSDEFLARQLVSAHQIHAQLAQTLLPALQQLLAWGCTQVALIPHGELHAVPWLEQLRRLPEGHDMRLRLYPSTAAWWQAGASRQAAHVTAMATTQAPRMATLMYDALGTNRPIPWIHAELALVRALWAQEPDSCWLSLPLNAPDWPPQAKADDQFRPEWTGAPPTVEGLLAVGHSRDAEGNEVGNGLYLGYDNQGHIRVFTALELNRIQHVRRLLLSCCTLGRVDDAMGEPHGMVSTAFAFHTHFAMGSLVRVGDVEAALFNVAYQWALREACLNKAASSTSLDWSSVFLKVQEGLIQGHWPQGFGKWLAQRLPDEAQALWLQMPASSTTHRRWQSAWGEALSNAVCRHSGVNVGRWRASALQQQALTDMVQQWSERPPQGLRELAHWLVCLGE